MRKSGARVLAVLVCAAMLLGPLPVARGAGYALLVGTCYAASGNYAGGQNDVRQMYDVLMNVLGWPKDNVMILQTDGQNTGLDRRMYGATESSWYYADSSWDLDGDGLVDIQPGAATGSNILAAIDSLAAIAQPTDHVFVFLGDHGGTYDSSGGSYFCAWDNTAISDTDLATRLNQFNVAQEVVIVQSCFSGGFIPDLDRAGRIVITQCAWNEFGYGYHYLPTVEYEWGTYNNHDADRTDFVNEFFWALTGPGDANLDGKVTVLEAFNYLLFNDDFGDYGIYVGAEHSQISDLSGIAGTATLVFPEPATLALVGLGSLVLLRLRRKR